MNDEVTMSLCFIVNSYKDAIQATHKGLCDILIAGMHQHEFVITACKLRERALSSIEQGYKDQDINRIHLAYHKYCHGTALLLEIQKRIDASKQLPKQDEL